MAAFGLLPKRLLMDNHIATCEAFALDKRLTTVTTVTVAITGLPAFNSPPISAVHAELSQPVPNPRARYTNE